MNTKRLIVSGLVALFGFAALPTIASAAPRHGHRVCHWDHHHHRACHWVH